MVFLPPEIYDLIREFKGYTLTELFYMKIPETRATGKRGAEGCRWIELFFSDRQSFCLFLDWDHICPEVQAWTEMIFDATMGDDYDEPEWTLEGENAVWESLCRRRTEARR